MVEIQHADGRALLQMLAAKHCIVLTWGSEGIPGTAILSIG
jgi:hypothetical protein